MELRDAVRRRRMVRRYDLERPVNRAQIDELLELAVHAPSAGFSQGWQFLVLDDPAAVSAYWAATAEPGPADSWLSGMRTAPVLIVAFSDKTAYLRRYAEPDKGHLDLDEHRWAVPFWHMDTAMASLLILLGAVDSGLVGCYFGVPKHRWDAVRGAFAVPQRLTPAAAITLGYPAPDLRATSPHRERRPMPAVTSYNSMAGLKLPYS